MKTRQRLTQVLGLALLMTLTACGISGTRATPTPSRLPTQVGTSTVVPPTAPATDVPATLPATAPRLAVLGTDNTTVSFVDPMVPDTRNARIGGVLPRGGTAGDTVYFLDYFTRTSVVAVDATGRRTLDFIQNPNYGLDVWPGDGDGPRLGWGVQPSGEQQTTQLFIGKPDGSEVQSVLQEAVSGDRPSHLVFERWASDGGSFYFSREPLGIGGYIPFAGASSLYRFDLATSSTTELIPFSMDGAGLVCIDDFYGEAQRVAERCGTPTVNIRDLTTGQVTSIQPPTDGSNLGPLGEAVSSHQLVGSARFSPDGQRVAYALAKGDPNDELGWVAVSEGLSGASKLVANSQPGSYFTVIGWLSDDVLLLQLNGVTPEIKPSVWVIGASGADGFQLVEGTFLALLGQ